GPQLLEAGRGVLILLRGDEGRGIGLVEKLRAYVLQDAGRDTVDANLDLGLPVDSRSFAAVPGLLEHLEVRAVRQLPHSPEHAHALVGGRIEVAGPVDLDIHPPPDNLPYLPTKRDRLGHHLLDLPALPTTTEGESA